MDERKKDFDAVKMMREARDRISHEIQGMSFDEQAAYFREHAGRARRKLEVVRSRHEALRPTA